MVKLNIDKLIKNSFLPSQVKDDYSKLYNWHVNTGKKLFLEKFPNEEFQWKYLEELENLIHPDEITIEGLIEFTEKIYCGAFQWAMMAEHDDGRLLGEIANILLKQKEKFRKARNKYFNKLSEQVILNTDPLLRRIKKEKLERKNIGGIVFLTQTNAQYTRDFITNPKMLGFEKVEDKRALVNLALEGKVEILKVRLIEGRNNDAYSIQISVKSTSLLPIRAKIPKGQIFENKKVGSRTQNLAVARENIKTIFPLIENNFVIGAFCLNQPMAPPIDEPGNITIFELENKQFMNGSELWKERDEYYDIFHS